MPNYDFQAFGTIRSSSEAYAVTDVLGALKSLSSISEIQVIIVPQHKLCDGSEEPATHVANSASPEHPYNLGRCQMCGVMVPLLSTGNFEVIKHLAPTNFKVSNNDHS